MIKRKRATQPSTGVKRRLVIGQPNFSYSKFYEPLASSYEKEDRENSIYGQYFINYHTVT